MRTLTKGPIPTILSDNKAIWDSAFAQNNQDRTARYRYRHPDIKRTLMGECAHKCAYCESKLGHNTPGDIEHKSPSSKYPHLHFEWQNLTIACTECNRRKRDYDTLVGPFLDPHEPGVENRIQHHGPVVVAVPGDPGAEICVRTLELDGRRPDLVRRKIEKISEINHLKCRIADCAVPLLKAVLERDLIRRTDSGEEFSGMVLSLL